jgi:hypothetical protein
MQHMVSSQNRRLPVLQSALPTAAARDCKSRDESRCAAACEVAHCATANRVPSANDCDLPTNTALQQQGECGVAASSPHLPCRHACWPPRRTAWRAAWCEEEAARRFSCAGLSSPRCLSVRSGARGCAAAAWFVACFIITRTRMRR